MAIDTGNGTVLTFGTSGFTAFFMEIGGTEQEVPDIKTSHLGTTVKETYIAGDLYESGEFECEFQANTSTNAQPTIGGTAETITITYPVPTGLTNGATLAGTGYVKKRKTAGAKNNELMMGNMTVKWDGVTGPTFTAAS